MGYQITYDRGVARKRKLLLHTVKQKRWLIGIFLLALAIIFALPAGRIWVRNLILPGNETVTVAALEGLAENLRQGQTFAEAVTAFCQQIIYGS